MSWIYLIVAAVFEIGWPVGLKLAQTGSYKLWWILFAVATMVASGVFLFLAQKQIPIGTAYAVWTGVGAVGTFTIGVLFFHDALSMMRFLGILLIISGVVVLKIGH